MPETNPVVPVALIVEEDADIRQQAVALLAESELKVIECESAEAALSVLQRLGPGIALILSEIRLPGLIDGVDLACLVKTHWPQVNMIVTSGDPGDRLSGLPDGATYVPKPWRALDVLMAAERALPSRQVNA
jgi:DNA-binding response OmpR family regulator